jgi:hypothetical protein
MPGQEESRARKSLISTPFRNQLPRLPPDISSCFEPLPAWFHCENLFATFGI